MRKKVIYTTCCLFVMAFCSCTEEGHYSGISDDSDTDVTDGEVVSDGFLPAANEDLGILFPVTSVRTTESGVSNFNYQGGKLLDGTSREEYDYEPSSFDFQIKENPLQISITPHDESYDSATKTRYTDIKTNKYGFITEARYNDEATVYRQLEASYNAQGYITKQKEYIETDNGYHSFTLNFVWSDGNLKQINAYFEEQKPYDNDESEYNYEWDTLTLEYGNNNYPNTGIYFWNYLYGYNIPFDFIWYSGLFGKTTKNIPISVENKIRYKKVIGKETLYDNERDEENYDIKPSYNQNGSISSITFKYSDSYMEEEENFQETYYFGYK